MKYNLKNLIKTILVFLLVSNQSLIIAHTYQIQVLGNPQTKQIIINLSDAHSLGDIEANQWELENIKKNLSQIGTLLILMESLSLHKFDIYNPEQLIKFHEFIEKNADNVPAHDTSWISSFNPKGFLYYFSKNLPAFPNVKLISIDPRMDATYLHHTILCISAMLRENMEYSAGEDLNYITFGALRKIIEYMSSNLEIIKESSCSTGLKNSLEELFLPIQKAYNEAVPKDFGSKEEEYDFFNTPFCTKFLKEYFFKTDKSGFLNNLITLINKNSVEFCYLLNLAKYNSEPKILAVMGGRHVDNMANAGYVEIYRNGITTEEILEKEEILRIQSEEEMPIIPVEENFKKLMYSLESFFLTASNDEIWEIYNHYRNTDERNKFIEQLIKK